MPSRKKDPGEDPLDNEAAAAFLGIKTPTWTSYQYARGARPPIAPPPDGKVGRSPYWYPSTLREWQATRKGPGNWTRGDTRSPGSRRHKTTREDDDG